MNTPKDTKCEETQLTQVLSPRYTSHSLELNTPKGWDIDNNTFLRQWVSTKGSNQELLDYIKYIISQVEQSAREEYEKKLIKNIYMLRQWLNEDRIDNVNKMVTNEDLKHWLTDNK